VVGEKRNSQIIVNLPVTDVQCCTSSNAKALGLKHLQLPDVAESSRPPDRARIVHHVTDEVPVDMAPFLIERQLLLFRRTQHSPPLSSFLPNLIDVRRTG
jgi:hypothetical protein